MMSIKHIIAAVVVAFFIGAAPISASAGILTALKTAFQQGKKATLHEFQFLIERPPGRNFDSNSWSAGQKPYSHKFHFSVPNVPVQNFIDFRDVAENLQIDNSDKERNPELRCSNSTASIGDWSCIAGRALSSRKILEHKTSHQQE